MNKRLLFPIAMLCVLVASCNRQGEQKPDLDNISIIYCTPTDLTQSLPLEIDNTADGWQAKYKGAPSKEIIRLSPRYSVNEDGDSIIVFDEMIGDKLNGRYFFGHITNNKYDEPHQYITYKNVKGEPMAEFYATIIKHGDIFVHHDDVAKDFKLLMLYDASDPVGCGSQRRDLNFTYLFHENPKTFTYQFKIEDEFKMVASDDGMLRIYDYYSWTGGNGFSADYYTLTAQYKTKSGVITLDGFEDILLSRMVDFKGGGFPKCGRLNVYQATLNGKKHYLVETVFYDPMPSSFDEKEPDILKSDDLALFAFTIENGKLMPSNILNGKSMIELVSVDCNDHIRFKYDDKTKTLQVPQLNANTHEFTGKYKEIKIG